MAEHEREVQIILKLVRDASITSESRNVSEIIKKVQAEGTKATKEASRATTAAVRETSSATKKAMYDVERHQRTARVQMQAFGSGVTQTLGGVTKLGRGLALLFAGNTKSSEELLKKLVRIQGAFDVLTGAIAIVSGISRAMRSLTAATAAATAAQTALNVAQLHGGATGVGAGVGAGRVAGGVGGGLVGGAGVGLAGRLAPLLANPWTIAGAGAVVGTAGYGYALYHREATQKHLLDKMPGMRTATERGVSGMLLATLGGPARLPFLAPFAPGMEDIRKLEEERRQEQFGEREKKLDPLLRRRFQLEQALAASRDRFRPLGTGLAIAQAVAQRTGANVQLLQDKQRQDPTGVAGPTMELAEHRHAMAVNHLITILREKQKVVMETARVEVRAAEQATQAALRQQQVAERGLMGAIRGKEAVGLAWGAADPRTRGMAEHAGRAVKAGTANARQAAEALRWAAPGSAMEYAAKQRLLTGPESKGMQEVYGPGWGKNITSAMRVFGKATEDAARRGFESADVVNKANAAATAFTRQIEEVFVRYHNLFSKGVTEKVSAIDAKVERLGQDFVDLAVMNAHTNLH